MTIQPIPVHDSLSDHYATQARAGASSCDPSNTLYPPAMPGDAAGFSLGCGNPITAASLQPGETALDLGSGGGLDCFLSAKQVGKSGRVLGVDMMPEMLKRARVTAVRLGVRKVEFREGYLENLPVEDGSVDVAGALDVSEYKTRLVKAGFSKVTVKPSDGSGIELESMPVSKVFSSLVTARKPVRRANQGGRR